MRDHLAAVQQISPRPAKNDFPTIEIRGTRWILRADGQMCETWRRRASFTESALKLITMPTNSVRPLANTTRKLSCRSWTNAQPCTGCHETYKQHVVDEADGRGRRGHPPPTTT